MFNRKKSGSKICQHDFRDVVIAGTMVLNGFPRKVQTCKKCGISIHVPIYSMKSLAEKETKELQNV